MNIPGPLQASILEKHRLATVGSFAAKIVHYLNNPMTLIRIHARFIEERLAAGEASGELASEAGSLSRELQDAVHDMQTLVIALSRYVQGDAPPEPLDLVECVSAAYHVAGMKMGYGAEFELIPPADGEPVVVHAVQAHLLQLLTAVFLHLGSNPAELGRVTARFEQPGAVLLIEDHRPSGLVANVPEGAEGDEFDPELGLTIAHLLAEEIGATLTFPPGPVATYRVSMPLSGSLSG